MTTYPTSGVWQYGNLSLDVSFNQGPDPQDLAYARDERNRILQERADTWNRKYQQTTEQFRAQVTEQARQQNKSFDEVLFNNIEDFQFQPYQLLVRASPLFISGMQQLRDYFSQRDPTHTLFWGAIKWGSITKAEKFDRAYSYDNRFCFRYNGQPISCSRLINCLAQEADAQLIALQNQHAENLKQAYEAACKAALDNAVAQAQESWRNVLADSQKTVLAHKGLYEIDEVVHVPVTLYDTPVEALNHARNASYRRHGSGPQDDPSIHLAALGTQDERDNRDDRTGHGGDGDSPPTIPDNIPPGSGNLPVPQGRMLTPFFDHETWLLAADDEQFKKLVTTLEQTLAHMMILLAQDAYATAKNPLPTAGIIVAGAACNPYLPPTPYVATAPKSRRYPGHSASSQPRRAAGGVGKVRSVAL